MTRTITKAFTLGLLILSIGHKSSNGQSPTAKMMHYKDFVGENPDADADIKLVSDYVHNLVSGDIDKATAVLASGFKGYGPSLNDSGDIQSVAAGWRHSDSVQQNRKVEFVSATFNVKSGDLAGHWVEMWGTYSFTEKGKDVKFPYQYSAHVKNGKIDMDYIYYDVLYILKALGYTVTPPSQ